jgi:negative regulator of sigma E activity
MTDQERDSQLSAMFDGELPGAECELLARRLARDAQMQRSWASYALIGTVLRSEPLAQRGFASDVSRRMVREEDAAARARANAAAGQRQGSGAGSLASSWWIPLSGVGVAAGVATLAVFFGGIPSQQELAESRLAQVRVAEVVLSAAAPAPAAVTEASVAATEPESYVTPLPDDGRAVAVGIAASLANYVVAHSSVSAPMLRHSTLSAFVTAELPEPLAPSDDSTPRPETR